MRAQAPQLNIQMLALARKNFRVVAVEAPMLLLSAVFSLVSVCHALAEYVPPAAAWAHLTNSTSLGPTCSTDSLGL